MMRVVVELTVEDVHQAIADFVAQRQKIAVTRSQVRVETDDDGAMTGAHVILMENEGQVVAEEREGYGGIAP